MNVIGTEEMETRALFVGIILDQIVEFKRGRSSILLGSFVLGV